MFAMTSIFNEQIILSMDELKKLNHSLLLFAQKKISSIEYKNRKSFFRDEISDTILETKDTIKHIEKIIQEDREIKKEIEYTQKEIILTMGTIGESRSKETGNHVRRVAEYSYLLAKLYGLKDEEAVLLKEASPMHDIGKIAIPDEILKKPTKLTDKEFEIMKTHTSLGYEMLKHSNRPILKAAAIVAYEHHEKYNGKGYPRGLKGDEIHIYGAITAIADVFDALGSDRVYKKAWSDEKILEFFKKEAGEHFDPRLVKLFLDNFNRFTEIRDKLEDTS